MTEKSSIGLTFKVGIGDELLDCCKNTQRENVIRMRLDSVDLGLGVCGRNGEGALTIKQTLEH